MVDFTRSRVRDSEVYSEYNVFFMDVLCCEASIDTDFISTCFTPEFLTASMAASVNICRIGCGNAKARKDGAAGATEGAAAGVNEDVAAGRVACLECALNIDNADMRDGKVICRIEAKVAGCQKCVRCYEHGLACKPLPGGLHPLFKQTESLRSDLRVSELNPQEIYKLSKQYHVSLDLFLKKFEESKQSEIKDKVHSWLTTTIEDDHKAYVLSRQTCKGSVDASKLADEQSPNWEIFDQNHETYASTNVDGADTDDETSNYRIHDDASSPDTPEDSLFHGTIGDYVVRNGSIHDSYDHDVSVDENPVPNNTPQSLALENFSHKPVMHEICTAGVSANHATKDFSRQSRTPEPRTPDKAVKNASRKGRTFNPYLTPIDRVIITINSSSSSDMSGPHIVRPVALSDPFVTRTALSDPFVDRDAADEDVFRDFDGVWA